MLVNKINFCRASLGWPVLAFALLVAMPVSAVFADEPAAQATTVDSKDANSGGAGDLLLAPTRVVLEGQTRSGEVTLVNKGTKEATYRISFTHLAMDDNGEYKELSDDEVKKSDVHFADDLLRYSPHQVTLKPGEAQVVKIMARKPEGLADGEYRSHMLFRAVPDVSTGENVEATKVQDGKIAIRLIPVYGISIPVILRQGQLSAQAKVTDVKVTDKTLNLTINRSGTESLYGDVFITETGTDNVIGQIRGIAVLVPNQQRKLSIQLNKAASGTLTIEYRQREEEGGKTLDKTSLNL